MASTTGTRRKTTARKRAKALTPADLKISPEVAWYLESRSIPLPKAWQVPLYKTPEPRRVKGAQFDPARVDKALQAFSEMRHTQGRWAGKSLRPDPWQIAYFIAPVFGWVKWNDEVAADAADGLGWVRIIREAMMDVPRKNGKTTIAGGCALYLTGGDDEAGAQVVAAAAGKEQAEFCFNPVKMLVEGSPGLRKHFRPMARLVLHKRSGSTFKAISSVADLIHGANIHGAVVDELHVHKTRDLLDGIETGTGARSQPLIVIITTPDDGTPGRIYGEKRERLEKLARGALKDPSGQFYGVVWGVATSEAEMVRLGIDPFSEAAWKAANPGYGVSPSKTFLEGEAANAKDSPAARARFLRLHLGLRTKQVARFISLESWDATAGVADEAELEGRMCHGGLDLSSVEDLTAWCLVFPEREMFYGEDGLPRTQTNRVHAVWRFFLPEDRLKDLDKRTAGQASVWVDEGYLQLTDGDVISNPAVVKQIRDDAARFNIATIGYDRWGANDVVRQLGEDGIECVGVSQGYAAMNAPMKEMLRLVLTKGLVHGGNPVARWMVDNLAVSVDTQGNYKPARDKSADKIDGVAALVDALKEVIDSDEADYPVEESVY